MKVGVVGGGPIAQALTALALEAGNDALLAGKRVRRRLPLCDDVAEIGAFSDLVLIALPAWEIRRTLELLRLEPRHRCVLFTRGLDSETGRWLTHIVPKLSPCVRVGVMAGPLVAAEVFKGIPTAVVAASEYRDVGRMTQDGLHSPRCRVYTSLDPYAVELAATMVAVLAVAVGISDGMGLGVGTRGIPVARGLAEASRLAGALAVDPGGLMGLAGLGELFAATSHPKHPAYLDGRAILDGQDRKKSEPIRAAATALAVARANGVELPLTAAIHAIAHGKLGAHDALTMLMERPAQEGEL